VTKKSWKNIILVKYLENKIFEKKIFHTKVAGFQQMHQTVIPIGLGAQVWRSFQSPKWKSSTFYSIFL